MASCDKLAAYFLCFIALAYRYTTEKQPQLVRLLSVRSGTHMITCIVH
jgi:hypothetical protein